MCGSDPRNAGGEQDVKVYCEVKDVITDSRRLGCCQQRSDPSVTFENMMSVGDISCSPKDHVGGSLYRQIIDKRSRLHTTE